MKKVLLAVFIICAAFAVNAENNPYKDLVNTHWAYGSVLRMSEFGIFKGIVKKGELTFQGDKALTRYEFAVATDRLVNKLLHPDQGDEIDVSDENFKLQSSLLTEMKNMMAGMQQDIMINKNSINKTIEKVKELEDRMGSKDTGQYKTLYYISIGSFIISVVALILAVS